MSYVIEQVGTEKSRLTLYSREDIRGKSPEWYSNNWDFICARHLLAIKDSFIRFPASRDSPNPFSQSPLEPDLGSSVSRQFSAPDPDSAHLNPSNPPSFLEKSPKIFGNYFKWILQEQCWHTSGISPPFLLIPIEYSIDHEFQNFELVL